MWDESGRVSAWSPAATFEAGLLGPADWTAQWIGSPGWDALVSPTPPATVAGQTFDRLVLWPRTDTLTADGQTANFPVDFTVQVADTADGPFTDAAVITGQPATEPAPLPAAPPVFARQFSLPTRPAKARLYITGLGVYTATINGRRVSDAVLEPGNTTYTEHLDYATADVTGLLREGSNTIGVRLGTGIYDTLTYNSRYAKFRGRIGPPKLLAQLEVTDAAGTRHTVVTDLTWRTTDGPTTFSNWYGGEDCDARRLPPGWDEPGADLSSWPAVSASAPPASGTVLTTRSGPPVEIVDVRPAQKVTQPQPGVYVFDIGTNLAGWPQLKVQGPAGTTIRMRPAELLAADGTIDYGSTGNPIYDDYTLRGGGAETWHPEFIYHGFRYIQVEGLPSAPSADTVTALVLRAANDSAGSFSCSNQLLNDIHRIIDRATQSNMYSVERQPARLRPGRLGHDQRVDAHRGDRHLRLLQGGRRAGLGRRGARQQRRRGHVPVAA